MRLFWFLNCSFDFYLSLLGSVPSGMFGVIELTGYKLLSPFLFADGTLGYYLDAWLWLLLCYWGYPGPLAFFALTPLLAPMTLWLAWTGPFTPISYP
jgi:hypothetical protein